MQRNTKASLLGPLILSVILGLPPLNLHAADEAAPAPAPPPEAAKKPLWETTISAGLTLSRGNSDTLLGTAKFEAMRKQLKNELRADADLTYGENQGVKNNDSIKASLQYNREFTERFYGLVRVEGMRDEIADIKYRVIVSPGVGYYFIKRDLGFPRGEVGPGFVSEQQGHDVKNYATLRVSERGEFKISRTAKFWEYLEVLPQVDKWSNYIINAEVGVDVSITTQFSLRTYVQDTFDNEPAPGRKKNDLKLVSGIAYKF